MASKSFTLAALREHLEGKYAALSIEGVKFRSLLALPDDRSVRFEELSKAMGNDDGLEGRERLAAMRSTMREMVLLFVSDAQEKAAARMLDELDPTLATYQELLALITEATQPGEASDSDD